MTPPIKPEVCVIDDRLAVFLGGDYKMLPLDVADRWVRKLQSELAKLRRQEKQRKRQLKREADTCTSEN